MKHMMWLLELMTLRTAPEIGGKHLLCSSVFDEQLVKGILISSLRLTDYLESKKSKIFFPPLG